MTNIYFYKDLSLQVQHPDVSSLPAITWQLSTIHWISQKLPWLLVLLTLHPYWPTVLSLHIHIRNSLSPTFWNGLFLWRLSGIWLPAHQLDRPLHTSHPDSPLRYYLFVWVSSCTSFDYIGGRPKGAIQMISLLAGLGISASMATGAAGLGTTFEIHR